MQKLFARMFGVVLIGLGILGFFDNPIIGNSGYFVVGIFDNAAHILFGLILISSGKEARAQHLLRIFGGLFIAFGIIGVWVNGELNWLGGLLRMGNTTDSGSIVLGLLCIGVSFLGRSRERMEVNLRR